MTPREAQARRTAFDALGADDMPTDSDGRTARDIASLKLNARCEKCLCMVSWAYDPKHDERRNFDLTPDRSGQFLIRWIDGRLEVSWWGPTGGQAREHRCPKPGDPRPPEPPSPTTPPYMPKGSRVDAPGWFDDDEFGGGLPASPFHW